MDLSRLQRHPWRAAFAYTALVALLYESATQAPHAHVFVIPATTFDLSVPLWPPAAYLYFSYALLLPALILLAKGRSGFASAFAAAMGCGLANAVLYNLFPTRIAFRPPGPPGTLLALLQGMDTTLGAMPSGHVALPTAIAASAFRLGLRGGKEDRFWKGLAGLFGAWALALAASTLLTKQHYLPDALMGFAFGIACAAAGPGLFRSFRTVNGASLLALLGEWAVIAAALAASWHWRNAPVAVAAGIVIATRQHAILVLYHDAVHGLLARRRRVNDFLINAFVGVPLFLPVHRYRSLHRSHHRHLGGDRDPERVLLYRGQPWDFRPLPGPALLRQLAGDLFLWNNVIMLFRYAREAKGPVLKLPATRAYPELVGQFLLFWGAVAAAYRFRPDAVMHVLLLWFIPYLTLTQFLQKIRSFAEHIASDLDAGLSCSWEPGMLGRLTIWPYNINLHREHHARAGIPWNRLPSAFPDVPRRPGADLPAHLWRKS